MNIFSHAITKIESGFDAILHTFQHEAGGVKTLVKAVPINFAAFMGQLEGQAHAVGYRLVKMTDDELASAKAELDARIAALAAPASPAPPAP